MKTLGPRSIAFLFLTAAACGNGGSGGPDAGPAGVTATVNPSSVAAGADVTMTVTTDNFVLEPPAGQPNQPGHGHYHILLDGNDDYLVADSTATVTVTIPAGTAAGAHTLTAELYNNDHSEIPPGTSDVVDITVTP